MPSIETNDLALHRSELLMVFWHARSCKWWATISPRMSDTIRAHGEGNTPEEALSMLFLETGAATMTRSDT